MALCFPGTKTLHFSHHRLGTRRIEDSQLRTAAVGSGSPLSPCPAPAHPPTARPSFNSGRCRGEPISCVFRLRWPRGSASCLCGHNPSASRWQGSRRDTPAPNPHCHQRGRVRGSKGEGSASHIGHVLCLCSWGLMLWPPAAWVVAWLRSVHAPGEKGGPVSPQLQAELGLSAQDSKEAADALPGARVGVSSEAPLPPPSPVSAVL